MMEIFPIARKIKEYQKAGQRLFATSSFQTHSVVLLHIISRIDPAIPVYFINTGYHFAETIRFRDEVTRLLGLNMINLNPYVPKVMQRTAQGNLLFTNDPDYCCYLNKVQPVENLFSFYDVWINGVRADQNQFRKQMAEEMPAQGNTLRYHPLLNWDRQSIEHYIARYNLPVHPLEQRGYKSIGCEPCTRPAQKDDQRGGRWSGMKKTECGLHNELINKK
ncbi:MAG: phosphoadenylyl-sulfate reductase [Bacteroidales bacterium]